MKTSATTKFEVSDVVPAEVPLPEVPYKQAVEALLVEWGDDEDDDDFIDDQRIEKAPSRPVEACARYHGRLVKKGTFHPFVASVHHAFMGHRPLCLSPDMIWLMICQGVSNHINAHAEELRPRLVEHQGRATLAVRRDDFVKGSLENPWPEVFSEFSAQIRSHVGPSIDRFLPDFTITGPVERAAAEVVMLEAVRSYFAYHLYTLCGIPTITLEGTPEDWHSVSERARSFADLDLGWWLDPLGRVLDQFTRASRGEVDQQFWRSMYKLNNESGGPKLTGWVLTLFPYLKDRRTGQATKRNPWLTEDSQRLRFEVVDEIEIEEEEFDETDLDGDELAEGEPWYEPDGPTMDRIPSGLSRAPFNWHYLEKTFDMEFLAGFVGIGQDSETLTLRPEIGWAVREAGETD